MRRHYPYPHDAVNTHTDGAMRHDAAMNAPDIKIIVAQNLRRWMDESADLSTQAAIAKKAKIGQSHVSRCLRGQSAITISVAAAIAKAFNRQAWELLVDPDSARQRVLDAILGPAPSKDEPPRPLKRAA